MPRCREPCSAARMRAARSIAWITRAPLSCLAIPEPEHDTLDAIFANSLDVSAIFGAIFDNVESDSHHTEGALQMDENTRWQKLAAEFLGTAFLVFVGVGSVPALLIVNDANGPRSAGRTSGSSRWRSPRSWSSRSTSSATSAATTSTPRSPSGWPPPGSSRGRRCPATSIAQVLGADRRRVRDRRRAGHEGQRHRPRRRGVRRRDPVVPGVLRRVHRHVPAGLRRLRRDLPQGGARLGRPRHRLGRVRRDHPGRARPPAPRSTRPAPPARCSCSRSSAASVGLGAVARLPRRRAARGRRGRAARSASSPTPPQDARRRPNRPPAAAAS